MREIIIKDDFIKLFQLLKYADMVGSGGEAKVAILDGLVKVNGDIEERKGKKIYKDDIVEFENEKVIIKYEE